MRIFATLAGALALSLTLGSQPVRAQDFLSAYEDLPLPAGLRETAGAGLSFDIPGGRIVEAYAQGRLSAADVTAFYAATLPQLGWTRTGAASYRRDAETLTLETRAQAGLVTVHFTIAPD